MGSVLVLDDDRTIGRQVADVVVYCGHTPLIENNSIVAVTKHGRSGLYAAIVDFHMPGLNGVEVLMALQDFSPNTRRILISASINEPEIQEAVALGIIQHAIEKPFTIEQIKLVLYPWKGA